MAIEAEALLARLEDRELRRLISEVVEWSDQHGMYSQMEYVDRAEIAAKGRNDAIEALVVHVSAHRSALAEDTARAAEGWEPIETAPKDGSLILVARPMPRGDYRAEASAWRSDTFGEYHWARDGGYDRSWNAPTHWRPLPAPPALPLDKEAADANR